MVSKAREDLPEPERPVKTISRSRGRSSETSRRLCSRAPRTTRRSAICGGYRDAVTALFGPPLKSLEGQVLFAPKGVHGRDQAIVGHGEDLNPSDVHDGATLQAKGDVESNSHLV